MNCLICQKNTSNDSQYCECCTQEAESLQAFEKKLKQAVLVEDPGELFWQKQRLFILERVKKDTSKAWFPSWVFNVSIAFVLLFLAYQFAWKAPVHEKNELTSVWFEESWEDEEDTQDLIDQLSPEQIEIAIKQMERKI